MPATALIYPKRRRRKTLAGVKATAKPWLDPSCLWWYDATDISSLTLWPVHAFGDSNKSYISTPSTPELNATTQLTIEMWVNLRTLTNDRAFASKSVYASDVCGWGIGGGGGVNQFNTVLFWARGMGGAFAAVSTAGYDLGVGEQLTHFVITFNAGTVKIWRNGVLETLVPTGTMPVAIGANNTALQIGNWSLYAGTSNFGCAVFRMWTADIGDTLAAALYGAGVPRFYNALPDAYKTNQLVVALDGDSKTCKRTGRVFTDTLTVDAEQICTQWRDKSRYGRNLNATFGRGYWLSTIASRRALRGYLQHGMGCATANALNAPTGSTFSIEYIDTLPNAERFFACSEDDDGNVTGKYGMTGFEYRDPSGGAPLAHYPGIRMRNDVAGTGGMVRVEDAAAAYAAATAYLINWNGPGSGGAASYTYWSNGVNYPTVIVPEGDGGVDEPVQNGWFNAVGETDALYIGTSLGGLALGGGNWYAGRRSISAAFGPAMSAEYREFVESLIGELGNVAA